MVRTMVVEIVGGGTVAKTTEGLHHLTVLASTVKGISPTAEAIAIEVDTML